MVALGSRLDHPSLTDPLIWALVTPFVLLVVLAHPVGRHLRRAHARHHAPR